MKKILYDELIHAVNNIREVKEDGTLDIDKDSLINIIDNYVLGDDTVYMDNTDNPLYDQYEILEINNSVPLPNLKKVRIKALDPDKLIYVYNDFIKETKEDVKNGNEDTEV